MEELKAKIKAFLRIKTSDPAIDGELEDLIAACEADMVRAGVSRGTASHKGRPLTVQAQKLYARAYFGSGDESDRFRQAYEALRDSIALGETERCRI